MSDQDIQQRYQALEQEQPPGELDQLILQRAHEYAQRQARTAQTAQPVRPVPWSRRYRQWLPPMGLAASVLIVGSILLMMPAQEQQSTLPPSAGQERPVGLSQPMQSRAPVLFQAESLMQQDGVRSSASAKPQADEMEKQAAPSPQSIQPDSGEAVREMAAESGRDDPVAEARAVMAVPAPIALDSPTTYRRSQQTWLEFIEHLLDQGDVIQAEQELQVFRQHYPRAELPEKLQAIEKQKK